VEIIETQNILLHQHNSTFDFLALTITTLQLFTPITVTSNGIDNVLKHLSLSLSLSLACCVTKNLKTSLCWLQVTVKEKGMIMVVFILWQ
jgi:hypothetical protein